MKIPPCTPGRKHRWEELTGFGWFSWSFVRECDCGLIWIHQMNGNTPPGGHDFYCRKEQA